jgi:hypothetical protein
MPALPDAPLPESQRRRSVARAQAIGEPLNGSVEGLGGAALVYEVRR